MANYIPESVIVNILLRLHVTTLLRCTCVCKSWYNLITSPQFISTHLNFTTCTRKIAPLALLRGCINDTELYTLHSDTESFDVVDKFDFPFKSTNSSFTIIGSCNGLLCLSDDRVYYMHTIIIWNPCVKKSVLLPKPNLIYNSYGSFMQSLGFGYDRVADDYKVVRITYVNYNVVPPQVELYKLSTGVWNDISDRLGLDHVVIYSKSRQAYIHGANHWIALCADSYDLIVLFDMCDEVFCEMRLPDSLAVTGQTMRKDMVVCLNSLALITWSLLEDLDSSFCVWVMKEYGDAKSWTKHFNVGLHGFGGGFSRLLGVRESGEVIAVCKDGRLVSYGSKDGEEVSDLGVRGSRSEDYQRSVHVERYTKSLVLLDRGLDFCDAVTCSRLPTIQGNDQR